MSSDSYEAIGETLVSMKVLKCNHEWRIPTFSTYTTRDTMYSSWNFHISNSTWFLTIKPHGNNTGPNAFTDVCIPLYLHRVSSTDPVTANIKCGIKTTNHIVVNEKQVVHTFTKDKPDIGWASFIEKSKLQKNKPMLLPSDTLTIVCCIEIKNPHAINSRFYQLSQDFRNLLTSKQNTDIVLNVSNSKYAAHKLILGARSPVFAAMFRSEMEENITGIVNIPDCDPESFVAFLIYLYTGAVHFSKCNICEVYKIAEKYDVFELKLICSDYMIKRLSLENFCDIFIVSEQFGDGRLRTEAQRFFERNFEKIVNSERWELLLQNNFRPANELLKSMAPKFKCNCDS